MSFQVTLTGIQIFQEEMGMFLKQHILLPVSLKCTMIEACNILTGRYLENIPFPIPSPESYGSQIKCSVTICRGSN